MTKKYLLLPTIKHSRESMQENLVIVESPAKAKTIEKFLGKDYKVMSSYGHIRDLKKKDLSSLAGISSASVTKLGKNENVNTETLEKICRALNCDISDIMEMSEDE